MTITAARNTAAGTLDIPFALAIGLAAGFVELLGFWPIYLALRRRSSACRPDGKPRGLTLRRARGAPGLSTSTRTSEDPRRLP